MENQRVHEYSVQTGPNGLPIAQLGITHNLITFCESGKDKIHYLDGKWVDDGQNPIDPETVPQHMKDQVSRIPFDPSRGNAGPDVLINCEFCEFTGPGKEYAKHLIDKHVPKGAKPAVAAPAPVNAEVKLKPEDLPPGDYVTDDEGFVVLNKDGSPRRKAGRPATTKE